MAEPGCKPMGNSGIQRILIEDRRVDRAGDFRLTPRYGLGFRPHARKYGLDAVKADELCIPLRGRTDKVHTASPLSPASEHRSPPPVNNAPAQSRTGYKSDIQLYLTPKSSGMKSAITTRKNRPYTKGRKERQITVFAREIQAHPVCRLYRLLPNYDPAPECRARAPPGTWRPGAGRRRRPYLSCRWR